MAYSDFSLEIISHYNGFEGKSLKKYPIGGIDVKPTFTEIVKVHYMNVSPAIGKNNKLTSQPTNYHRIEI